MRNSSLMLTSAGLPFAQPSALTLQLRAHRSNLHGYWTHPEEASKLCQSLHFQSSCALSLAGVSSANQRHVSRHSEHKKDERQLPNVTDIVFAMWVIA